jgi:hypothetical protein
MAALPPDIAGASLLPDPGRVVVAPSLIPMKAGDRVKTDRRDALMLAKLHRAGELTPIWIPDAAHEAMRDLVRARATAGRVLSKARQHLQGFLLHHARIYRGTRAWTLAYRRWLTTVRFDHPAQQIVLQDYIHAVQDAEARRDRLTPQTSTPIRLYDSAPRPLSAPGLVFSSPSFRAPATTSWFAGGRRRLCVLASPGVPGSCAQAALERAHQIEHRRRGGDLFRPDRQPFHLRLDQLDPN